MCQEETSESLEGVFLGGVINYGKNLLKRSDSLFKLRGSSKFFWSLTSNGEVLMKELSMWYSLWYWNNLSDWGKRATNRLEPWKGLKLTVEMTKMTVEMLKIWQISLPRWIFLSFGKHCKINACKWAKLILISLLFENFWKKNWMKSRFLLLWIYLNIFVWFCYWDNPSKIHVTLLVFVIIIVIIFILVTVQCCGNSFFNSTFLMVCPRLFESQLG